MRHDGMRVIFVWPWGKSPCCPIAPFERPQAGPPGGDVERAAAPGMLLRQTLVEQGRTNNRLMVCDGWMNWWEDG